MSNYTRIFFSLLVALLILGVASPAVAAAADWQSVDVILHADEQQPMLLVSGSLPAGTQLPAEVELAVPAGTQVLWIGEILGGPVSADPQVQYVKRTEGEMDIYAFTLTESLTAQIEAEALRPGTADGVSFSSTIRWTAWRDLAEVHIAQRLPQGTTIGQKADGATMEPGAPGYTYYAKTVSNPRAGDVIELAFTYTPGAAPAPTTSTAGSGASSGVLWVVGAVFAVFLGLLIYRVRGNAETRRLKPTTVICGVAGILVIGVAFAVNASTAPRAVGATITKSFGAANPCAAASIPVTANEGVDLATQGEQIIDAFTGMEGVGDVTLDVARSVVEITFCESSQSEASVRQTIASTGLVSVATASAETTAASPTEE